MERVLVVEEGLSALPDDVLRLVIELLDPVSIFSLCGTSALLQRFVPPCVSTLSFQACPLDLSLSLSASLLVNGGRFAQLRSVVLGEWSGSALLSSPEGLLRACASLPALTSLRLVGASLSSPALLAIESLPHLQVLELVDCSMALKAKHQGGAPLWSHTLNALTAVHTYVPPTWVTPHLGAFAGRIDPSYMEPLGRCERLYSLGLIETSLCALRMHTVWKTILGRLSHLLLYGCDLSLRSFLEGNTLPPLEDFLKQAQGLQWLSVCSPWIRGEGAHSPYLFSQESLLSRLIPHWPSSTLVGLELSPTSGLSLEFVEGILAHSPKLHSLRLCDSRCGVGEQVGGRVTPPLAPAPLLSALSSTLKFLRRLALPRLSEPLQLGLLTTPCPLFPNLKSLFVAGERRAWGDGSQPPSSPPSFTFNVRPQVTISYSILCSWGLEDAVVKGGRRPPAWRGGGGEGGGGGGTFTAPTPALLSLRYQGAMEEGEREALMVARCPQRWAGCNFFAVAREEHPTFLPSGPVTAHLKTCPFAVYTCISCGRDVAGGGRGALCGLQDCGVIGKGRCCMPHITGDALDVARERAAAQSSSISS